MKNEKVIVVNGLTRSGTNIVWNLIQSHPQVCSPIKETGKLLYNNKFGKLAWRLIGQHPRVFSPVEKQLTEYMDSVFFEHKMSNQEHDSYSFKSHDQKYTSEEIEKTVLCLKSVDHDIRLSSYFEKMYDNAYFVGVVRNGYAFCNGWVRRGRSPRVAGNAYRKFVGRMLEDQKKYQNYIFVRFEEALSKPFKTSSRIFRFADLTPEQIDSLRLKSKAVLSKNGDHKPKYGKLNSIHWFDQESIKDLLDPKVNQVQANSLSRNDRRQFESEAMPLMKKLNFV